MPDGIAEINTPTVLVNFGNSLFVDGCGVRATVGARTAAPKRASHGLTPATRHPQAQIGADRERLLLPLLQS
jgi:hypothetical protein